MGKMSLLEIAEDIYLQFRGNKVDRVHYNVFTLSVNKMAIHISSTETTIKESLKEQGSKMYNEIRRFENIIFIN